MTSMPDTDRHDLNGSVPNADAERFGDETETPDAGIAAAGAASDPRDERWNDADRERMYPRLLEAVRAWTESYGPWSREEIADHLGYTQVRLDPLFSRALKEGVVKKEGYRLVASGVPLPSDDTMPQGFSPDEWAELTTSADLWGATQPGLVGAKAVARHFKDIGRRLPLALAERLLRELTSAGKTICPKSPKGGYLWLSQNREAVSLDTLLSCAQRHVDDTATIAPGAKGGGHRRTVPSITSSGLTKITTVVRLICEGIAREQAPSCADHVEPVSPAAVAGAHFEWDESREDWALVARVRDWTDERAHRKAATSGKVLDRQKLKASRDKNVDAIRLLLNLADTHGILGTTTRRSAATSAEWLQFARSHVDAIVQANDGVNREGLSNGLCVLGKWAANLNYFVPATTDWNHVRTTICNARQAGKILECSFSDARQAYRLLRRLGRITAGEWPGALGKRHGLFDARALRAVTTDVSRATLHSRAALDFSAWTLPDGQMAESLVEGRFGLRRAIDWMMREESLLISLSLPPRCFPQMEQRPADAKRQHRAQRSTENNAYYLKPGTVRGRLERINSYLGWIVQHHKDLPLTLESVLDYDLIRDWAAATAQRRGRDDGSYPTVVRATLGDLAIIANPCLAAMALQDGVNDGRGGEWTADHEMAAKFQLVGDQLRHLRHAKHEEAAKNREEIVRAWGSKAFEDERDAWHQLYRLLRAQMDEMAQEANGLSLVEQVEAIRAGNLRRTQRWAVAARMAIAIYVLRRVPLRARALCGLTLKMWKNSATLANDRIDALEPWEGAIQLVIPHVLNKNGKPFSPWLISPKEATGDDALTYRALLEVYFMNGGAREYLCTYNVRTPGGDVSEIVGECGFVFPVIARRSVTGLDAGASLPSVPSWAPGDLSQHFAAFVMERAEQLQMNVNALRSNRGSTSIHVIRLLYGTFWAPKDLMRASAMLHHKNALITAKLYCTSSETVGFRDIAPPDMQMGLAA